jgi:hypothetical protein
LVLLIGCSPSRDEGLAPPSPSDAAILPDAGLADRDSGVPELDAASGAPDGGQPGLAQAPVVWTPDETTGPQRAVALLVRDDDSPIPCEQAELEVFFDEVEAWFRRVSHGRLDLRFDPIVAWLDLDIPPGQTSNFDPLLEAAANQRDVDFRGATRIFAGFTAGSGGESPGARRELRVADADGAIPFWPPSPS